MSSCMFSSRRDAGPAHPYDGASARFLQRESALDHSASRVLRCDGYTVLDRRRHGGSRRLSKVAARPPGPACGPGLCRASRPATPSISTRSRHVRVGRPWRHWLCTKRPPPGNSPDDRRPCALDSRPRNHGGRVGAREAAPAAEVERVIGQLADRSSTPDVIIVCSVRPGLPSRDTAQARPATFRGRQGTRRSRPSVWEYRSLRARSGPGRAVS